MSADARRRRDRVLRVRVVSCSTVGQLEVYMSAMSENQTPYASAESAILSFQFPNGGVERMSADARRRRGLVLRVRIYSG